MFSRGGFLYKRSQNGAHRNLVARASPTLSSVAVVTAPSTSPSSSSDAKTTDSVNSLTSAAVPVSQTTVTPANPPPPSTPSSSTPTASSPAAASSASSLSSSNSKASTASSSSLAVTASSVVSTPLTLAPTTTAHAASVATQIVTGTLSIPTLSPSTTSSTGSSGTTNTGAIVGGVAGTIAGIAVLGFLLMWCMRRQRNRDIDDFDAQAFKRQSAVLLDDSVEPSRSYNPRPPTMIERHNASPALAAQSGYTSQNFYGSYDGYGQQPHAPSEMIQSVDSPPQAYGAPPMGYTNYNDPQQQVAMQNVGYAGYDSQHQLVRQPSNAAYLTRLPSSAAGFVPPTAPPGSIDPNAHYIDLNRSSISPYQAAQYADISRQLGTTNPSGQAPRESTELPDAPLPSPFDDPIEATPVSNVTSHRAHLDRPSGAAAPGPVSATPARQTQENAHQRPATIYEEGDAYSGI